MVIEERITHVITNTHHPSPVTGHLSPGLVRYRPASNTCFAV
jgi:hypothetical protein